ncbi:MAG: hypothetical protein GPJ52_00180 [Candidatus Heimdallarchaeota archaeon]|nr:hypothetical protein [Candidatus Heimdallarchaeota archaeon]
MRKLNYRLNFLLILYCVNIFLIFLAQYASSKFDGDISGFHSIIDFKVGFLGNWMEHRFFPGYSEGTSIGSANEIGTYYNSIIVFLILGLFFCIFGAAITGVRSGTDKPEQNLQKNKGLIVTKLIGSMSSIIGGIFGIISLIMFTLFKATIIQPYDAEGFFPLNNTPAIRLAPSYYLSLVIYLVFVITGILLFVQSLRLFRQFNYQEDILSTDFIE